MLLAEFSMASPILASRSLDDDFVDVASLLTRDDPRYSIPEETDQHLDLRVETYDLGETRLAGDGTGRPFDAEPALPHVQHQVLDGAAARSVILALLQLVVAAGADHHENRRNRAPALAPGLSGALALRCRLDIHREI